MNPGARRQCRHRVLAVTTCLMAIGAAARAQSPRPAAAGDVPLRPCATAADALERFSSDLYCMDLVPTPDLRQLSGTAELGRVVSPFGISVTADGTVAYDVTVSLRDLPDPATLGPYTTYVVWATTPILRPMLKLGVVGNGDHTVGRVALNKFLILVSAERTGDVTEREGRLVLRGTSPSMRMQPDQHLMFNPISTTASSAGASHDHDGDRSGETWRMPPMHPAVPMLPGMEDLRPSVSPFRPRVDGRVIPAARPRELMVLSDGDSIELEATFVRRHLVGHSVVMYGFNGQYPGPLLFVPQRATLTVWFRNSIDLPSAVHWHGLRLDNRFDGAPGVTQEPVQPGDSFRYEVHFPDAGLYWYHPHVREDIQQDLGLYGNMLVRPDDPAYFGPANREEFLLLDDLLIDRDGLVPHGRETATHALMGRFGNVMLVNGVPDYAVDVAAGEVVRFFLTNVSNTRTFNLGLPNARMKLVASDLGKFERETWVETVVIAPAERYVVDVQFDQPGVTPLTNHVQGLNHLFGTYFSERDTLALVRVRAPRTTVDHTTAFDTLRVNHDVVRDIDRYRDHFDRPVDHALRLRLETDSLPFAVDFMMRMDSAYFSPVEWSGTMPMMNWVSTGHEVQWILEEPDSGLRNEAIQWRFRRGDVVKIRLANERRSLHAMQHPIHIHGQRFLVLAQNGVPNDNLVWKDTFLIPVGSTADILLELSNPGRWMLHCHIAEHLQSGMMFVFEVTE